MKDKDVLFISIATLVTALAWVVFDAYHAYTTATIAPELEEIAIPITPKIDTNIINDLKKRGEPTHFVGEQNNPVPTVNSSASGSAEVKL